MKGEIGVSFCHWGMCVTRGLAYFLDELPLRTAELRYELFAEIMGNDSRHFGLSGESAGVRDRYDKDRDFTLPQ